MQCIVGNTWSPGSVVAHNYMEARFSGPMPYQVRLDTRDGAGELIWAPADQEECIRRAAA